MGHALRDDQQIYIAALDGPLSRRSNSAGKHGRICSTSWTKNTHLLQGDTGFASAP
jgi:hypothetical protein